MCLCASVCVSQSMSILDQCEIEAAVIKRIRCFSDVRCWTLCVCLAVQTYKCPQGRHRANGLHGELEFWQYSGFVHACVQVSLCVYTYIHIFMNVHLSILYCFGVCDFMWINTIKVSHTAAHLLSECQSIQSFQYLIDAPL